MQPVIPNAPKSAALFERSRQVMPSGYTRQMTVQKPHPLYAHHAEGCWITDVEGGRRVDYTNNFTALIHGHGRREILEAITQQSGNLISSIMPTEPEVQLAELLCERIPSCEEVRFMNSGTEAVMIAVKAARAFTGKSKIAKVEGGYHGQFDLTETSFQPSPELWGDPKAPNAVSNQVGTPQSVLDEVVVLPLNDIESSRALLRRHADELSLVIIDPLRMQMGLVEPELDYLTMLREETERLGIVLIFDEVMSLRSSYSGTQGLKGITPDLTTMGKIIGGGFPIGALGGKREFMSVFSIDEGDPKVKHSGTFTANPMSMHIGHVAMELMTPAAFDELDRLGQRLRGELEEIRAHFGIPGYVEGVGSVGALIMSENHIGNYRELALAARNGLLERIAVFQSLLMEEGLSTMRGGFILSTAMDDEVIDFTLQGVRNALAKMKSMF
ncbi:aspartate aminotransferase family protein [Pseudomaricurvus alkylphenolicus]|uniref:aspartate aminotransferase family protein n=1 Tax=Pseudomaricurvus alkylphenolicus TaxID=1306991 RepID=UPI0014233B37|nr:aspartate aminotransferase family protein [Pseudomaricurvus alkylphenolicus]NIB42461.1 aspartate aminotransferase family protein [Pseudomaricurvus alkylphenolicus]